MPSIPRSARSGAVTGPEWWGLFSRRDPDAVYTTNVVGSLNMTLREVIKTRASFPNEESALKPMYLALRNVSRRCRSASTWRISMNYFTPLWGDRIEAAQQRPAR